MKKILAPKTFYKVSALLTVLLFSAFTGVFGRFSSAETLGEELRKVEVKIFWTNGCSHCAEEKEFLEKLSLEDENVVIKDYEVSRNVNNLRLLEEYGEKLSANISSVPFTVIGETDYVTGFRSDETTGLSIVNKIRKIRGELPLNTLDWDVVEKVVEQEDNPPNKGKIDLLIVKNIDLEKLSLPLLTVVLALADGLNPCAMWVLLFLIGLLVNVKDPKRRWLIGGTFILASGIVYFLFLTAWLKFFLFIGFVEWIRYLIGTVALVASFLYIKDFIKNPSGCKVVGGNESRKKIFGKLREYALEDNLFVSMMGITALAFGVNLVEFFCSAGLPATYSNILVMSNLGSGTYYAYMVLYVVIFMIDDFIIFAIGMVTLKAVGMESKYAHWAHLIGGLVMLFIGLALLFKPELLMFG